MTQSFKGYNTENQQYMFIKWLLVKCMIVLYLQAAKISSPKIEITTVNKLVFP